MYLRFCILRRHETHLTIKNKTKQRKRNKKEKNPNNNSAHNKQLVHNYNRYTYNYLEKNPTSN